MQVLVLGGTSFVGRAIVEDLLARGHTPTLFNRGLTGADLFPGVARLVGDRDSEDYAALAGHRWEAVVDVTAYQPRHVEQAVAALGSHGRYVFISTGMVYDHDAADGAITEASPRLAPHVDDEVLDDEAYGPLKVACEDALLAHFGDRLSVVRPGWVVGPHEPTDRLTYWVRNAARGHAIAVPERLDRPVQLIDVRDVARLVTILLERDLPGAFNAVVLRRQSRSLILCGPAGTQSSFRWPRATWTSRCSFPIRRGTRCSASATPPLWPPGCRPHRWHRPSPTHVRGTSHEVHPRS